MLVRRLNLAWKSGRPNQRLRLGNDVERDRTFGERFRKSANCGEGKPEGRVSVNAQLRKHLRAGIQFGKNSRAGSPTHFTRGGGNAQHPLLNSWLPALKAWPLLSSPAVAGIHCSPIHLFQNCGLRSEDAAQRPGYRSS